MGKHVNDSFTVTWKKKLEKKSTLVSNKAFQTHLLTTVTASYNLQFAQQK